MSKTKVTKDQPGHGQESGKGGASEEAPPIGRMNTGDRVFSTRPAVERALEHIREWAKWMSGIQTAAIAGLGVIVTDDHKIPLKLSSLSLWGWRWAGVAFICLSLALLFNAWVLSSVASLSLRLGVHEVGEGATPNLDVYRWPSFTWFGNEGVNLGTLMGLQHWSWFIGLSAFAVVCFLRFG